MFKSAIGKTALILSSTLAFVSLSASAVDLTGIEAGIRQQSASSETVGMTTSTEMAYQFGIVGVFPMSERIGFRSGFFYTQRPVTTKFGATTTKYTFNYFDIPATIIMNVNDYGGVYAGVNVGLAASADCDNCGVSVDKKGVTPFVIGGMFKFGPGFGVDVYYEMTGKQNDSFKDASAVGANLLITFD